MRKMINEYKLDGDVAHLTIESTKYQTITVTFDSKFYDTVRLFSWCYEQSKGKVFCVDVKLGMPKKLGIIGYKFFLDKLIMFLHTGSNRVKWRRKKMFDYRVSSPGIIKPLDSKKDSGIITSSCQQSQPPVLESVTI